jgi:polyribonucleotide nucleotidyltransferase
MEKIFEMDFAGRKLSMETGKYAKQAGGSVLVRYGDTVVLCAATASAEPREGMDFFPLTVDYEERSYAVGKIPGGFIKREGRPTEKATLACRLTDRTLRPLFPDGFRNDVHLVSTVLSVEQDNLPEICSIIGASAALCISEIAFHGPIGAAVVGMIDGEYILNPTTEQREASTLHILVSASRDAVVMVEAAADGAAEDIMLNGIMFGFEKIQELLDLQEKMVQEIGKDKKSYTLFSIPDDIKQAVKDYSYEKITAAAFHPDKQTREENLAGVKKEIKEHFSQIYPEQMKLVSEALGKLIKEIVRTGIIKDGIRPDGRKLDEIRPIWSEVGILPRAHGSAVFTRGQTQVLTVATLGSLDDVQRMDGLGDDESKRYIHHYNFPPFSVGEARPMRGPGRREIGHGALAEKALVPVLPSVDDFPYAIRLVSEAIESNGSTSQASICGSTMALMNAGVPIKEAVAGVAMGLVKDENGFAILTDIQGVEDALGDMDFKVAGTKDGITAIQMDIKIRGLSRAILEQALEQARQGRLFILDKMTETISEPQKELSPYAPRIYTLEIDPDKIRDIIGPGGKVIRKIVEETKVKIDIEDDGKVYLAACDYEAAKKAIDWISSIVKEVEVGETYKGKVMRLMNFGAFVQILPNKEGLVHISQFSYERVEKIEDVVAIGDEIEVKVIEIDSQGRINLSHRALLPAPEGFVERKPSERGARDDQRGGFRGNRDNRR